MSYILSYIHKVQSILLDILDHHLESVSTDDVERCVALPDIAFHKSLWVRDFDEHMVEEASYATISCANVRERAQKVMTQRISQEK